MIFKIKAQKARLFALPAAAILLLSLLSGCQSDGSVSDVTSTSAPSESTSAAATVSDNSAKSIAEKLLKSDIEIAIEYVRNRQFDGSKVSYPYESEKTAYAELDAAQKKLYDEMLPKVQDMLPFEYTAKEYGYDVLDNVLIAASALCDDHPLCGIYFEIADVVEGDMTAALKATYFLPSDPESKDTQDTAAIKSEIRVFEEECNLIVNAIPEDFSTYDKYRYLAAVISLRTVYDYTYSGGRQISTAYGAIAGPTAICQGYSIGFEYLCRKANLWCELVSGVSQGESHAWNLVKLESGTYHVDVTWADSDQNVTLDDGWQRYFMLTQDEILTDHEIDDGTVATGTPIE